MVQTGLLNSDFRTASRGWKGVHRLRRHCEQTLAVPCIAELPEGVDLLYALAQDIDMIQDMLTHTEREERAARRASYQAYRQRKSTIA
eukprot:5503622-Amphidinium_carterae.1